MSEPTSPTVRHVLILTCLCAIAYLPGLINHGLTNWQEAQRALVFQQMHEQGAWLVPTVHGDPYLAKPPMIYWWQRAFSMLLGNRTDILPLRLTVAIAGWLGVIATYAAGRVLLRSEEDNTRKSATASLLGASMLATGLLYVRSSRIGELDILLTWPTSLSILLCFVLMTRKHTPKQLWICSLLLFATTACAAMTKGPPAVVAIVCAFIGGHVLNCAVHHARFRTPIFLAGGVLASIAAVISFWIRGSLQNLDANAIIGLVYVIASIGIITFLVANACTHLKALAQITKQPLPLIAILLGALTAVGWIAIVARSIGWDNVRSAMEYETGDNLRLFVLDAPMHNIEAMAFGVGLGSIVMIGALFVGTLQTLRSGWGFWKQLDQGTLWIVAWVLGSLFVFSIIGKGVPRYLTPVWPGVALLAGVAAMHTKLPNRATSSVILLACAILAIGQGWWYGYGREARFANRSPRDLIHAFKASANDNTALFALDHWSPALDFYWGKSVVPVMENGPDIHVAGVHPISLNSLHDFVAEHTAIFVIARREARAEYDTTYPAGRLAALGFVVQEIAQLPAYTIDNGRSATVVLKVTR
ncbi:MAG: glycosyltransferase family 39 protein [Phycisphaeraceae bacterium]|nr:glycosyltransferase family 39 protein [Phycisphaerales bacterium]MCB9861686.1 glycosyltransferase family 39 protein [Phycisphaeraceae bacterium]